MLKTFALNTNHSFLFCLLLPLLQLAMEAGVGIAVLVRCFVSKQNMEADIVDRLGKDFSRAPFAAVVVCSYMVGVCLGRFLNHLNLYYNETDLFCCSIIF